MNAFMQSLASDGWTEVVKALLHTFWEGALLALVLFFVLKRVVNPVLRHRYCLWALSAILLGGICTWAVLDSSRTMHRQIAGSVASVQTTKTEIAASPKVGKINFTPMEAGEEGKVPVVTGSRWIAWLALVWLTGMALMLTRAVRSVAGAERLRRSATPLKDEAMLRLIQEARGKLGLARQIRVVVTEKLTSPAVAGILMPTLILPLSLVTAMPMNQLQLIVLHELAHIRRGDYLANLFQLLAESLLFFNPAVWWISRLLRQEREACCDAMAISLAAGERIDYARTLAQVAERSLDAKLVAAPGFADGKDRPGLADRVQRVLVPGYRPDLRLTWRALAGSLFLGGTLLLLSALGTQWTVKAAARLLTPQERMDRIEATMKDLGEAPVSFADNHPAGEVEITIQVRMADGSPVPSRRDSYMYYETVLRNSSLGGVGSLGSNGLIKMKVKRGDFYIGTFVKGYAPTMLGPIDTRGTNIAQPVELVVDRGFPISIQVLDTDSGKAIPGVTLAYSFWFPKLGSHVGNPLTATTGDDGTAHLTNCASYPFHVSVQADGFESGETVFEHLTANENLVIHIRRALPIAGHVTDAKTGLPLAGATVLMVGVKDAPGIYTSSPGMSGNTPIAKTDPEGNFTIAQLPRSGRYWLLCQFPGHAGVLFSNIQTGQTNLNAALGPEMIVRGRIEGDLSSINTARGPFQGNARPGINAILSLGDDMNSIGQFLPVRVENGVGYFEFTNLVAGPATVEFGGWRGTTNATASVDDWVIKIGDGTDVSKREVVIRFENASGVAPKGTVSLTLPGPMPNTGVDRELEITNGEVHCEALPGRQLSISPSHMIGFWFNPENDIKVVEGAGAQVISIPVIPAGAIYAHALDTNGSPVSDANFSVREIKRSSRVSATAFPLPGPGGGIISGEATRNYVASPLPLDGTYAIVAYHGNNFTASRPVALSETDPDRKVELQFHQGTRVEGQVFTPTGEPATNVEVGLACVLMDCNYGLKGTRTDESGRFVFEDCNPASGKLVINLRSPGLRSVGLTVDFNKLPLTVRFQPGLKLSGQVVDDKGKPLPHSQVTAMSPDGSASLPPEQTFTDDQGQFELTSLSDAKYLLFANHQNPGYYSSNPVEIKAGSKKPVVIKMTSLAAGN